MKWNDFLQIIRVRAVEEADARDDVWDAATLRAATMAHKHDPVARAAELLGNSRASELLSSLRVPQAPGWVIVLGAIAAFVTGWWFAVLGQEHEINLLALPLIAILLWNAVVLLLSLFHGLKGSSSEESPSWLGHLLDRFSPAAPDTPGDASDRMAEIRARFRALLWPVWLQRTGFRLRAWLHLGAALLAFGSIAGMYARGWSTEYRAVWESTLLGEHGARVFFQTLFAPASKVTGVAMPLDELPQMRRGAGTPAAHPGAALPWIHLYAATLGLLVIVPRLLFAGLERARADRIPAMEIRGGDWRDYLAGIRASAEGDGATVAIVAYALSPDDASRERWRRMARSRWRDAGGVECRMIAPGGETDFVRSWSPSAPRVLMVFNLAVTPEIEVHRVLAEEILAKLRQTHATATLLLALDDTELKRRWSGFADAAPKLEGRAGSWRETMRGVAADWV